MIRRASRALMLGTAVACAAGAGGLFWQHEQHASAGFTPPAEDVCRVPRARVASGHAFDPGSGLGIHDPRPVPPDARCAVCGMYPARAPTWAAQLIFTDGMAHFFDSPADLFLFLAEPARFDAPRQDEAAAALYVADHGGGGWIDARQALYVLGSDARGPMRGPDLPAFADEAAASRFSARHGGRVVGFAAIDAGVVAGLRDTTHAAGHLH